MGWIAAAYERVGVGYDPSEIPPILSYPIMTKDLSNRPLANIYLTDFKLSHSSNLNSDDRSEVSDLTHLSLSNEALVPVIPKRPFSRNLADESLD